MTAFGHSLRKRCTGAHCSWRGRCVNHALPTTNTNGLIWPTRVEDSCDWYEYKGSRAHIEVEEEND